MNKASSMGKDGSNLNKSRFSCNFCHSLVDSKNFIILFWNIGLFMVREKVEEVMFFIRNISKAIHNSQSRIGVRVSYLTKVQVGGLQFH